MQDLAHDTMCRDHHCFSNTVIGWLYRVCLGVEEHKQWCDREGFFWLGARARVSR